MQTWICLCTPSSQLRDMASLRMHSDRALGPCPASCLFNSRHPNSDTTKSRSLAVGQAASLSIHIFFVSSDFMFEQYPAPHRCGFGLPIQVCCWEPSSNSSTHPPPAGPSGLCTNLIRGNALLHNVCTAPQNLHTEGHLDMCCCVPAGLHGVLASWVGQCDEGRPAGRSPGPAEPSLG